MSEPVAAEMSRGARTIGDILLQLGFVDQEGLAAAGERQQVTGQPIGQVLVESGTITRLELATALAEQWADPSSPGPRWLDDPRGPVAVPAVESLDLPSSSVVTTEPSGLAPRLAALEASVAELRDGEGGAYLSQLQDAVRELARRAAGSEAAAADLADRVESSNTALERLRLLDAEVGAAAQRLDAVAAGVEVAVHGLHAEVSGIASKVDGLSHRVGEVADTAADAAALDELREALRQLAARPAADPDLGARLADVLVRVDALPQAAELEELRTSLADLAGRPSSDPVLVDAVEELRAVVAEYAERAAEDTTAAERVDGLAQRVEELSARSGAIPDLAARVDGLFERLNELTAELAVHDGDVTVVDELRGSVTELTGRVEALAAVASASVDADAVEALKVALDELSGRTAADPALAARIDALVEHVALLPDGHELQALRDTLAELASRPVADPDLSDRVERLVARVDELASVDPAEAVSARASELAGRVDELAAHLHELAETSEAGSSLATELSDVRAVLADRLLQLDELAGRLDELASAAKIDGDEGRGDAAAERAVVLGRVERLEQAVIELAHSTQSYDARAIDAVNDRLALLERDGADAADLERVAGAIDIVRAEIHDRLTSMAAELQGFDGRLDGLTARPALEPEAEQRVAKIEAKLAELASGAAAGGERRVAGSALTGDSVEDIERLRMSIERLGHTIGEQGRAIAELMKMRGDNDALERLTSRIEALEDGGVPGGGGEGGPPSAGLGTLTRRVDDTDAALEKLLTQLERMGSSLDWRFRRLEEMVGGGG